MNKKIDAIKEFQNEVAQNVRKLSNDQELKKASLEWMTQANYGRYSYNFSYLGRPIIQYPNDILAMQEIIWEVKPDLIIETGIAHGGSLIFSASMLALLDYCEPAKNCSSFSKKNRKVLGIDIEIRSHNRSEIENHPLSPLIQMIEGPSTDSAVIKKVYEISSNYKNILVCLDSNHTHEHVLEELKTYAPLVSKGSYCVVFDTLIDQMPDDMFPDRAWGKNNNPKTAVNAYLKDNNDFVIDEDISQKLQISVCPGGYLKKTK